VAGAAHTCEREQRRGLIDVRTFRITRIGALAIPRDGDVVYVVRTELGRVDERKEVREKKSGGDLFRRAWIGRGLRANRVIKSESLWHDVRCEVVALAVG
jgi:hypothetical protein